MPDDQQRRVDRDVPDSEAGKPDDKAKQPKKPGLIRRHPIAFVAAIVVVGRKSGTRAEIGDEIGDRPRFRPPIMVSG
jgi:hypothetical protein